MVYTIPDLSYLECNACTGLPTPQPFPVFVVILCLELVVLMSFKARVAHDFPHNLFHFSHEYGQVLIAV